MILDSIQQRMLKTFLCHHAGHARVNADLKPVAWQQTPRSNGLGPLGVGPPKRIMHGYVGGVSETT